MTLEGLWHSASPGHLSPWQQALALGMRHASKDVYGGHVCVKWIASKLRKTDASGKAYSDEAPKHSSVSGLFQKVDADPRWYPGKISGTKRGPKPVLTGTKRARIAASPILPRQSRPKEGTRFVKVKVAWTELARPTSFPQGCRGSRIRGRAFGFEGVQMA